MTAQSAPREGAKAPSVWAGPQPSLSWAPVHDQVAAQVRLSGPAGSRPPGSTRGVGLAGRAGWPR